MSSNTDESIWGAIGIGLLVWFGIEYWQIIFPIIIGIIAIVAIVWFAVRKHKKNEETKRIEEEKRTATAEKRKAARKAAAEKRKEAEEKRLLELDINQVGFWNFISKGKRTKNKKETDEILCEILDYSIVIDTNIWMDSRLDAFWNDLFEQCSSNNCKIIIYSSNFDEVERLKSSSNEEKRCRARLALNRIKKFSDSDLLIIENIKNKIDSSAYADPDIINLCKELRRKHKDFCLITNDKALIVRARHCLFESQKNKKTETSKILSIGYTKYNIGEPQSDIIRF